jgi:hypothetical protein
MSADESTRVAPAAPPARDAPRRPSGGDGAIEGRGQPMDEPEFDRRGRGQPIDEPELDAVGQPPSAPERAVRSRGQPMDEPEFD